MAAVAWEPQPNLMVSWRRGSFRLRLDRRSPDGTWFSTEITAAAYQVGDGSLKTARATALKFIADCDTEPGSATREAT